MLSLHKRGCTSANYKHACICIRFALFLFVQASLLIVAKPFYACFCTSCVPRPASVDSALKSIDLMHFGWNIGKAFGKRRIHTATFIKNVFADALRDLEITTIERKMSHTESKCRIKLDGGANSTLINISLC